MAMYNANQKEMERNAALRQQAAKKKNAERYSTAGEAIGTVAGAIAAIYTGNPMLIQTGRNMGKTVGTVASGDGDISDADGIMEGVDSIASAVNAEDAKDTVDVTGDTPPPAGPTPDGPMSMDEYRAYLREEDKNKKKKKKKNSTGGVDVSQIMGLVNKFSSMGGGETGGGGMGGMGGGSGNGMV
jgi:hypothetical protein